MTKKAPGKAHCEGLTLVQLMDMFPTEEAATEWFESVIWPDGERHCGKCGGMRTREVPNAKPMPYWCTDCRSYFSVRTGTPIARSNVPLRKWALAIFLCPDKPQERRQHEAASGYRRFAAYGLVHAAPHPGSLGRGGRRPVRRPGRVRTKPMSAVSGPTCRTQSGRRRLVAALWTWWRS